MRITGRLLLGAPLCAALLFGAKARAQECAAPIVSDGCEYGSEEKVCGRKGGFEFPSKYGDADFLEACKGHDDCWGTCDEVKDTCDLTFREQMELACLFAYPDAPIKQRLCAQPARAYHLAVRSDYRTPYLPLLLETALNALKLASLETFDAAQLEACECAVIREPTAIQAVLRERYDRLRTCYERLLASDPTAGGRVTTRFVISSEGTVTSACVMDSEIENAGTLECFLSVFRNTSFGPAAEPVTVVFPVVYEPG